MTAPRHIVVRTCGLYGRHATRAKGNFVTTILRLSTERDRLEIVHDQRCTPTATADLAPVLVELLASESYGVWHATNSGGCTWYEFACEIARLSGLPVEIVPTTSDKFVRPARRPAYSVLDCSRLSALRGHALPHWTESLASFLRESPV
jgi:dTDP-4-dehydrorhamnose reductase